MSLTLNLLDTPNPLSILLAVDDKIGNTVRVSTIPAADERAAHIVPSLVCPEGVLNGPQTIAKHLVKAVKGSLLAPKNTDGPMVDQWLTFLVNDLERASGVNAKIPLLFVLNSMLQPLVFVVSGKLTFVDVFFYTALHPLLAALTPAERQPFVNVLRYFDYIQYLLYSMVPEARQATLLPRLDLNCGSSTTWAALPEFITPTAHPPPPGHAASAAPAPEKEKKPKDAKKEKGTAPGGSAAPVPAAAPAPTESPALASTSAEGPAAAAAEGHTKGERKPKEPKEKKDKPEQHKEEGEPFAKIDIRVGYVTKVERHPNADSLYVEQIDIGEAVPRTIVSGLVPYMPPEAILNTKVLVLANLKPKEMRGIASAGMVLAAHDEPNKTKVELLRPHPDAAPGTRVNVEGIAPEEPAPLGPKTWPAAQPAFTTAPDCTVTYNGKPLTTPQGPVKVSSLVAAAIS